MSTSSPRLSADPYTPRPKSRPGRKPRLHPDMIIDAAFRVSERHGAQALTIQAIGEELGAHPTAIYRHFRDRDDLMLALLDALHAESLDGVPEPSDDWVEDLRDLARRTHAAFLRHPQIAQFSGVRTARREHEYRKVDRVIGCLRRAGFDDVDAARYYRVFSDFILAYAAQDAALAALAAETRAADLKAWDVNYRQLSEREYPNITAVAHALPSLDDPANFATALSLMLDALRARAATVRG
ncbi:TetR/AcrR family transcriptional regulator [Specibacter cremeus]|uniref:TetR/AcrR family transcriptional regulator n=1 Tax=Specibacter cremeus TaxID=1629051 RepID=UPI000F76B78D|nr:TetR/AcrR family transcriptional regulator [Specibacter cremeus]